MTKRGPMCRVRALPGPTILPATTRPGPSTHTPAASVSHSCSMELATRKARPGLPVCVWGGGGSSFPRHSPAAAPLGSREDRSPGRGLARASTPAGGRALGCEAPAPTEDTRPLHVTPARVTGRVKAGPDLHAPRRVSNRQRPLWACASLQGGAALPVHHCSSGVAASVPRAMPSWFHVSHRRPTHWAWLPLPKGRGSFALPAGQTSSLFGGRSSLA